MKQKLKITSLLLSALLFFTVNCQAEKEKDFYGYEEEELSVVLTGLVLNKGFTDLRDGTVLDQQNNIIYDKCTAGQVYRQAENDCRGAQSPSLFTPNDVLRFGARPMFYCSNNTWACNSRAFPYPLVANAGFVVPGESEAFKFCDSKNQANGFPGWRVANPGELIRLTAGGRLAMLEHFPDTQEGWYWSEWGKPDELEGTLAVAVSFERDNFGEDKSFIKTEKKYIRCVRPRTPVTN